MTICCICLTKCWKFYKTITLRCRHTFHSKCIEDVILRHSRKCPLCLDYIFSTNDLWILKHQTIEGDISDPIQLLKEAIDQKKLKLVDSLISLYDPGNLLIEYIRQEDVFGIKLLLKSCKMNWYQTIQEKYVIDIVKDLIKNKNPSIRELFNGVIKKRQAPKIPL